MGLYSNFPYTDFENLNLDWIIKTVREYVDRIDDVEIDIEEVKKYVQDKITEIETFVDDYFENLDVQEEINNKLEEMYESGELSDIIQQYLQVSSLLTFNTKSELKNASNLIDGVDTLTLGGTDYLDGNTNLYKIRTVTSGDVVDDVNILSLVNYPTLIAERIPKTDRGVYINVKTLGAVGDGVTDDSTIINNAINDYGYVYIPSGTYYMGSYMDIKDNTHIISDNATILYDDNTTGYLTNPVRFTKVFSVKNVIIEDITFKAHFKRSIYTTQDKYLLVGVSEGSENIEFNNCKFISSSDPNVNNMGCNVWISLGANKLITINNCYFENLTDQVEGGCLWVFGNQKNIEVNNCEFHHTCSDETVACWGVDATVYPEMSMNSCRIIQSLTSYNRPNQALVSYQYGVINFNNGYITTNRRGTSNIIRAHNYGVLRITNTLIDYYNIQYWELLLAQSNAELIIDNCIINYTKDSTADRLLVFDIQGGKLTMTNNIINMEFLQAFTGSRVIVFDYTTDNDYVKFINNTINLIGNITQNIGDFCSNDCNPNIVSYNNLVNNKTENAVTINGYGNASTSFKGNNNIINGTINTNTLLL